MGHLVEESNESLHISMDWMRKKEMKKMKKMMMMKMMMMMMMMVMKDTKEVKKEAGIWNKKRRLVVKHAL